MRLAQAANSWLCVLFIHSADLHCLAAVWIRLLFAALKHKSERCRRILRFGNLIQAPIAKDSGRPSSIIRFRILQAINASASYDLG